MIARTVLLVLAAAAIAEAQTPDAGRQGMLRATLHATLFDELPTTDSLYQLLDATQAPLVADRFFGGGLHTGQAGRIGGFLASWTQTLFRVGDVSVTDPGGGGAPMLAPDLLLWSEVRVDAAAMDADLNAAGLAVSLEPRRPARAWTRTIQATTSHFGTARRGGTPPIARLTGWDRATIVASGPLVAERLGLVTGGAWTRGAQVERAESSPTSAWSASSWAHLVFTPTSRDEIRTLAWAERVAAPFTLRLPFAQPDARTTGSAVHLQSTWEQRGLNARWWRAYAGYSRRHHTPGADLQATIPVFERLSDGPVSQLASVADQTTHQWSIGAKLGAPTVSAAGARHTLQAGLEATGAGVRSSSFFSGVAGELVGGLPARVWRLARFGVESFRRDLGLSGHVSDRAVITPRITVDGGVRYDLLSGSAHGAAQGIRWSAVLPRGALRWTLATPWAPTLVAAYSRSAYRLPLDLLAMGDPVAPSADIFRWNAFSGAPSTVTTVGPLVARAGPGTSGDSSFVRIDPGLKRPRSDEIVAGIAARPSPRVRVQLLGVARRERHLMGLVNIGAPAYAVAGVLDPGPDVGAIEDDRLVPVYNRLIESFGDDRYLLTTGPQQDATFNGIEISAELTSPRLIVLIGATAGRAVASAAHRGFGPLENDQSLVGEITANPNATTFARGRPFTDRAYTAKVILVYRLPRATSLGLIARYQDGQPFARLLVVPGLNQGAEAVRAFANGDSRFMFTGTLDVRLQKRLTLGARPAAVVLDAYNLLGLSNSVEELTTAPPDVRIATALQPPLTLHLSLRVTF